MKDEIDLSIILVSWNTWELTRECLFSLRANRPARRSMEVILVDEASADGSAQMVADEFPEVILLCNEKKEGFTYSNNRGLARARGRLLLSLNTDTLVHPEALDRLCDLAEARPDLGFVSARLLNTDGTIQGNTYCFPTPWSVFSNEILHRLPDRFFASMRLAAKGILGTEPSATPCDDSSCPHQLIYSESLLGACMLCRREVYERIGGMDERYPVWCNDNAWCWQSQRHGYRRATLTCARITHHGGSSTRVQTARAGDNRAWYLGNLQGHMDLLRQSHGPVISFLTRAALLPRFLIGTTANLLRLPLIRMPEKRKAVQMNADKFWRAFLLYAFYRPYATHE